ncbi:unnamed protein product [Caenorhabditis angaria]|uniref:Uncharacterized protein n=1 Tax=Caenorhabditis angaria TaxID=860376 RepID=A0A9P1INV5_9PELO|nr:unnamed protein product [Caenorhabditis angaria]
MDKSAAAAYEKIDKKVADNLEAAREILQNLREDAKKAEPRARKPTKKPVDGALTPRTKRNLLEKPEKKNRPVGFNESMKPLASMEDLHRTRERSCPPDSLFPTASYKPMSERSIDLCNQRLSAFSPKVVYSNTSQSDSTSYSTTSTTATITRSDSSIDKLLSKNRKTYEMFPAASFKPGKGKNRVIPLSTESLKATSSSSGQSVDSISMSQLPMTFFSTDGKMKMLLAKSDGNEHVAGFLAKVKPNKEEPSFPSIPVQLASSHKIKPPCRNKFNAVVRIGNTTLDISGIFNKKQLNVSSVEKLVINGKTYAK